MRERILTADDGPVERRLDQTVRGFGYEPAVALLDESGHVRALADIEAEAIRFAIRAPRKIPLAKSPRI